MRPVSPSGLDLPRRKAEPVAARKRNASRPRRYWFRPALAGSSKPTQTLCIRFAG